MERYSSYKSTSMQWLKEIPSHWDFLVGKKIYLRNDGGVWGIDPLNDGKDTIVLRSTEQAVDGKLIIENPAKRYLSEKEKQGSLLEENDLIITKSSGSPAHIGKTSIINKEVAQLKCCYSNFIQRIRIKGCPMYYWFVFNSTLIKTQFDILTTTTTGLKNISAKIIDRVLLPYPPLAEQEKIVSFLEDKTFKIDAYVADKEKEIELLQELKQKTIADAVTKGLNPDAKMKDSGISWIGDIPEHWEVKQLRSFLTLFTEKGHGDAQLLSVTREQGVIERDKEDKEENHNFVPDDLSGYKYIEKGDFAINKMKAWQGSYAVSEYNGIVSPAYFTCKLKGVNKDFFSKAIRSKVYVPFFTQYSKGIRVGQWDLNPNALKSIPFFLPPSDEQQAIVAYIEEKCEKIDKLASELQSEIDYLKEYKQRLIADCVTGQVKV